MSVGGDRFTRRGRRFLAVSLLVALAGAGAVAAVLLRAPGAAHRPGVVVPPPVAVTGPGLVEVTLPDGNRLAVVGVLSDPVPVSATDPTPAGFGTALVVGFTRTPGPDLALALAAADGSGAPLQHVATLPDGLWVVHGPVEFPCAVPGADRRGQLLVHAGSFARQVPLQPCASATGPPDALPAAQDAAPPFHVQDVRLDRWVWAVYGRSAIDQPVPGAFLYLRVPDGLVASAGSVTMSDERWVVFFPPLPPAWLTDGLRLQYGGYTWSLPAARLAPGR